MTSKILTQTHGAWDAGHIYNLDHSQAYQPQQVRKYNQVCLECRKALEKCEETSGTRYFRGKRSRCSLFRIVCEQNDSRCEACHKSSEYCAPKQRQWDSHMQQRCGRCCHSGLPCGPPVQNPNTIPSFGPSHSGARINPPVTDAPEPAAARDETSTLKYDLTREEKRER